MAVSVEQYLDIHPMAAWDRNTWNQYDAMVNVRFHKADVYFSPLADYLSFPSGVGLNQAFYTGRELIRSHTNHNEIGWYSRYVDSMYVDTRERRLMSRKHYGGKAQFDRLDELVTRFGSNDGEFIRAVMNAQLLNQVVEVHERITRDAYLNNMPYKFLANGTPFATGADFSVLTGETYKFDVRFLEEVALRMAIRSESVLKQWGDYSQPVPGQNFRDSVLVMVPTSVYWDLQNSIDSQYAIDLRQLSDQRIINGGKVMWRNMVVQDYGPALSLWNAGVITVQGTVTEPIRWGDGAPDPTSGPSVDNIWMTGQSSADVKHYVQLDAGTDMSKYSKHDFVTIHTRRTDKWGVTNGVDFLDGETMTQEIWDIDAAGHKLIFRNPITYQYDKPLSPGCYAFVTRAQHIYPIYIVGARGGVVWAGRQKIEWNHPSDVEADFPSVERVTWHERGEMNLWEPNMVEIAFATGSWANRGGVSIR